jgi:hypothetical protein
MFGGDSMSSFALSPPPNSEERGPMREIEASGWIVKQKAWYAVN